MVEKQHRWSLSWDSTGMLSGAFQAFHFNRFIAPRTLFSFFLSSDRCKRSWFRAHNCHFGVRVLFQVVLEFSFQLTTFHGHFWTDSCICSHEEYWKAFWRWFHQSLMHEHRKKPHYRAKSPSPKVSPFSEPRLEPSLASQLLIRVGTLLFFHSGAIYHVHRKHGALTRNLSTNTATADNLKHTSDPETLSFTRNDPLRTSVPSRGWGARIQW